VRILTGEFFLGERRLEGKTLCDVVCEIANLSFGQLANLIMPDEIWELLSDGQFFAQITLYGPDMSRSVRGAPPFRVRSTSNRAQTPAHR